MFLTQSTSLSTLLKKQLSLGESALFVSISQVSLSHPNQWFRSYLIFYGGSLGLLFLQLFLFSFCFFFLLCFWGFQQFIYFLTQKKTLHLFVHFLFLQVCSHNPVCSHNSILCCCAPSTLSKPSKIPLIWAFLPGVASCSV